MTVRDAIDSIYEVFGLPGNAAAPTIMKRRIFNDLNSAMQLLWAKGNRLFDFYTRRNQTVTIQANAASVELSDDVQSVLGSVATGSPRVLLRPIRSRGEYDAFYSIYANSLTTLANATPQAYYVEATRSASGPDATTITLFVVPRPSVTTNLEMEVTLKAPSFTEADYNASPSTSIPIPHNYAETLLLPIARYVACSSLFFADKSKQREPQLKAEYDRALQSLAEAST